MTTMNDLFPSKFLKKEDASTPILATIKSVGKEKIGNDPAQEPKAILQFHGSIKPMVLNRSNATIISSIYGSDLTNWIGKTIEVYCDPTVMYQGRMVGGLKLRAPQHQQHNASAVLTYPQAQAECERVGISKDELLAAIKAAGIKNTNEPAFTPLVRKLVADKVNAEQGGAMDGFDGADVPFADDGQIPF